MALEIERKFLVCPAGLRLPRGVRIEQAYFPIRNSTGRIRVSDGRAWLTVKGPPRGIARTELEHPIPLPLARVLLSSLCNPGRVAKRRHKLRFGGRTWEVDAFLGLNRGLIVAEVELPRSNAAVRIPPWAVQEVTTDRRFTNSWLAKHPFTSWPTGAQTKIRAAMRGQG